VPLGDLDSPASFLDAWILKESVPLWFEFLEKAIDEGERVRKENREVEIEEEEEEDSMNWGLSEGFAVNKYIITVNMYDEFDAVLQWTMLCAALFYFPLQRQTHRRTGMSYTRDFHLPRTVIYITHTLQCDC
jgi:hypothetical protein